MHGEQVRAEAPVVGVEQVEIPLLHLPGHKLADTRLPYETGEQNPGGDLAEGDRTRPRAPTVDVDVDLVPAVSHGASLLGTMSLPGRRLCVNGI